MCVHVRSGEPLNVHSGRPLYKKRKAASRCTQSGKPLEVRSGKPQIKAVNRCTQSGKPLQVRSGKPLQAAPPLSRSRAAWGNEKIAC